MGMLQNQNPPSIPLAPPKYDQAYMSALSNVLRLFYNQINAVQTLNLAGLSLNVGTLPTEASLATLRVGDVYRDTADNSLKVKV